MRARKHRCGLRDSIESSCWDWLPPFLLSSVSFQGWGKDTEGWSRKRVQVEEGVPLFTAVLV